MGPLGSRPTHQPISRTRYVPLNREWLAFRELPATDGKLWSKHPSSLLTCVSSKGPFVQKLPDVSSDFSPVDCGCHSSVKSPCSILPLYHFLLAKSMFVLAHYSYLNLISMFPLLRRANKMGLGKRQTVKPMESPSAPKCIKMSGICGSSPPFWSEIIDPLTHWPIPKRSSYGFWKLDPPDFIREFLNRNPHENCHENNLGGANPML